MQTIYEHFETHYPLIIAHRGFAENCHENTIEAFDKAIRIGADMVELDVRKTRDEYIIVFHDVSIGNIPISTLDYTEIKKIGLSAGYEIPTLDEALSFLSQRVPIIIEIKEDGYEQDIVKIITSFLDVDKFIIISFHDDVIKRIKEIKFQIATGLLLGKENPKNRIVTRLSELFPFHRLRKSGADLAIPHYKIIKIWRFIKLLRPKMKLITWTVNEKEEMRKMMKNRVAGIITDDPSLAMQLRDSQQLKLS